MLRGEIRVPLIADAMGEVRRVRCVVGGEGTVEVVPVRQHSVVVARPVRGRRVREQNIMPVDAVSRELDMVPPPLRATGPC